MSPRTAAQNRGIQRERDVKKRLEADGWWVGRAAGSLGDADLFAAKAGKRSRLIEVKSTQAGPFVGFGPADREGLLTAARVAGADAWLVWWPKNQQLTWIAPDAWPKARTTDPNLPLTEAA